MPRVITELRDGASLTPTELDELWAVYAPHHHTSREDFERRIREGLDGLALYRRPGTLEVVGMTGMRRREVELPGGGRALALYSGGSFVEPEFRGLHLLQRFLARHAVSWKLRHPLGRVYIWFDALSFKTYMIAARNPHEYYPSRGWETPPAMRALMDQLGRDTYGDHYDPDTCAIRKDARRLKEHVAPIGPRELADPDIAFYVERNPGYTGGDGLLTVIPFTLVNLTATMARGLWKQLRPRSSPVPRVSPAT